MASPHVAGAVALCMTTEGDCTGNEPADVITRLRTAAAAQAAGYGFVGDPNSPITSLGRTLYYGNLLFVGGY
jgi:hypothetical protein